MFEHLGAEDASERRVFQMRHILYVGDDVHSPRAILNVHNGDAGCTLGKKISVGRPSRPAVHGRTTYELRNGRGDVRPEALAG